MQPECAATVGTDPSRIRAFCDAEGSVPAKLPSRRPERYAGINGRSTLIVTMYLNRCNQTTLVSQGQTLWGFVTPDRCQGLSLSGWSDDPWAGVGGCSVMIAATRLYHCNRNALRPYGQTLRAFVPFVMLKGLSLPSCQVGDLSVCRYKRSIHTNRYFVS